MGRNDENNGGMFKGVLLLLLFFMIFAGIGGFILHRTYRNHQATKNYVTENTLIVVEASLKTDFDYLDKLGFEVEKEKRYKNNKHVFIRRKDS